MLRFLTRRLAQLLPTLLGITLVTFAIIHLAPGEPTPGGEFDPAATPVSREALAQFRAEMGLDQPLPVQYARWLGRMATLNLGTSLRDGRPVASALAEALPRTLLLGALALLLLIAVGLPAGVHAALRPDSLGERLTRAAMLALSALPNFWLAVLLVDLFAGEGGLPIQGLTSEGAEALGPLARLGDLAAHLVLPVTCLAYGGWVTLARQVRGALRDELAQDYVRTARAKGLPERRVVLGHALRGALLPALGLLGTLVPHLLGGSVVVETVFGIPGLGRLGFDAVATRDYPVLMGVAVVGALATVLGNLAADLASAALDPRLGRADG